MNSLEYRIGQYIKCNNFNFKLCAELDRSELKLNKESLASEFYVFDQEMRSTHEQKFILHSPLPAH